MTKMIFSFFTWREDPKKKKKKRFGDTHTNIYIVPAPLYK